MSRSTVKVMTDETRCKRYDKLFIDNEPYVWDEEEGRVLPARFTYNMPIKMYAQLKTKLSRSSAESCFVTSSSRCVSPNRRSPSVQDQYRWQRQNHVGPNKLLITHDFFQRSSKCLKISQFQERLFTKRARFSRVPKDTRPSNTFKGGECSFSELKKSQFLFPIQETFSVI